MLFYLWYCNNWLYRVPPHMLSWLTWRNTEGAACKEVKKPNLLLFYWISVILYCWFFLTFALCTKQTNSCSLLKRCPCRSWLVPNVLKQVKNLGNYSWIFQHFIFVSLEKIWYIVISNECIYSYQSSTTLFSVSSIVPNQIFFLFFEGTLSIVMWCFSS